MYKNLPTLDEVHYMDSIADLRNSLRWCIRQIDYLESVIESLKRDSGVDI